MKERPILYNAEMVNAVLDDRKTNTRRMIKLKEGERFCDFNGLGNAVFTVDEKTYREVKCPFGKAGDRLYVRENFCLPDGAYNYMYQADMPMKWAAKDTMHDEDVTLEAKDYKWTPSIHMPRAASRIDLEITDIRVERLQDISEEDARAEGVTARKPMFLDDINPIHVYAFRDLWNSIYKNWNDNPWVWVVKFKRVVS